MANVSHKIYVIVALTLRYPLPRRLCFCLFWFVCLLAASLNKLSMEFDEILREGQKWHGINWLDFTSDLDYQY